jgi:protein TonB
MRRYAFNAFLFLWVTGLHAAVVFAFEGTQLPPNPIDGSAIEIKIGLDAESWTNPPTNEHDIHRAIAPEPALESELEPEPESALEIEREPTTETVATVTPEPRVPQPAIPNKPKPELKTKASIAKQMQAVTGSTESTRTPSPAPRKVSRLEYMGAPPRPAYPSRALKGRQQGLVVVRVVIDRSGHVSNAAVWQSSGSDALDQSALQAVQTTRFKPYQDHGVAQAATADIPFNFVLKR